MIDKPIPDVVIARLPIYLQTLNQVQREGVEFISSNDLALRLGIGAPQIRKDLSAFGEFGRQGKGYNVIRLVNELREILQLNRIWKVALVGVGNLGQALLRYEGFASKGFEIDLAYDNRPDMVGKDFSGVKVRDIALLEEEIPQHNVKIAILTVPAGVAQKITDKMVAVGVSAILNYAPVTLQVPKGVWVLDIDPVMKLQNLAYYLPVSNGA